MILLGALFFVGLVLTVTGAMIGDDWTLGLGVVVATVSSFVFFGLPVAALVLDWWF